MGQAKRFRSPNSQASTLPVGFVLAILLVAGAYLIEAKPVEAAEVVSALFSAPPTETASDFGSDSEHLLTSAVLPATQPPAHRNTGFLDFNLYPYTSVESENSFTLNALANLPHGFQYFSLTNYGRDSEHSELEEVMNIVTEQNLRWSPSADSPWAIAAQTLIRDGDDNDALRVGPRFTFHKTPWLKDCLAAASVKYAVAIYGAQFDHTDDYEWQIEHVFRWNVLPEQLDNRVYIGGFVDHNIVNGSSTWLEETQLGIRLMGDCYFITEQRYNGFRRGSESSIGIGLEYVVHFR